MHLLDILLTPVSVSTSVPLGVFSTSVSSYVFLILLLPLNVQFDFSSFILGVLTRFLWMSLCLSDLIDKFAAQQARVYCLYLAGFNCKQINHILDLITLLLGVHNGQEVTRFLQAQLVELSRRKRREEGQITQVLVYLVARPTDLRTRIILLERGEVLLFIDHWILLAIGKTRIR